MLSLAFNLIFFSQVIKNLFKSNMFVHSCWSIVLFLVECLGFEFKFYLNSIRLELVWEKERRRKNQKWKRANQPTNSPQPNPPPPPFLTLRPSFPARSATSLPPALAQAARACSRARTSTPAAPPLAIVSAPPPARPRALDRPIWIQRSQTEPAESNRWDTGQRLSVLHKSPSISW